MNTVIRIADTSIPQGVINIVEQLPSMDDLKEEQVKITLLFEDAYIYRTGLVLLATWRKTLPSHVEVSVDASECQEASKRVLANSGFLELVENNVEVPSNIYYYPGRVPLQPLVRGYSQEIAIGQICKIFEDSAGQLDTNSFRTLLSELCENAFVHSEFESPGYISAHLHRDWCEIAIADSGIGILNSYLEGTNEDAKGRVLRGASAVDIALDGLKSSKPTPLPGTTRSFYGYGLYVVRRLIEENKGRMTIVSGDECVTIQRGHKTRCALHRTWNGTFVGLLIDLQNPLPLDAVYNEGVDLLVPKKAKGAERAAEPNRPQHKEFALSQYGNQLLSREVGVSIRADVAMLLSSGSAVRVGLDGIDDLTPSVADECFGKLAEAMGEERFRQYVSFEGGHPLVLRLIDFVVGKRLSAK